MATLTIDNLPDDLMAQLQQLATQNNQPLNEQVISLLKQALQKPQPPLKFLISPKLTPPGKNAVKQPHKFLLISNAVEKNCLQILNG
jgi:plasmid stability protein